MTIKKVMHALWQKRKIFFVCFFLLLLIARAPASLLNQLVAGYYPALQLSAAEGSVWRGKVANAGLAVNGSYLPVGELQWQFHPWSFLVFQPAMSIESDWPGQQVSMRLAIGFSGLSISELRAEFPLSIIEPWAPLLVKGRAFVAIDELQLSSDSLLHAEGLIHLRELLWLGGDVHMPLGNYQTDVTTDKKIITLNLQDNQANLGLTGDVKVKPGGDYEINLRAQARENLNPAVIKTLSFMGKKQADGDIVIKRSGSWK